MRFKSANGSRVGVKQRHMILTELNKEEKRKKMFEKSNELRRAARHEHLTSRRKMMSSNDTIDDDPTLDGDESSASEQKDKDSSSSNIENSNVWESKIPSEEAILASFQSYCQGMSQTELSVKSTALRSYKDVLLKIMDLQRCPLYNKRDHLQFNNLLKQRTYYAFTSFFREEKGWGLNMLLDLFKSPEYLDLYFDALWIVINLTGLEPLPGREITQVFTILIEEFHIHHVLLQLLIEPIIQSHRCIEHVIWALGNLLGESIQFRDIIVQAIRPEHIDALAPLIEYGTKDSIRTVALFTLRNIMKSELQFPRIIMFQSPETKQEGETKKIVYLHNKLFPVIIKAFQQCEFNDTWYSECAITGTVLVTQYMIDSTLPDYQQISDYIRSNPWFVEKVSSMLDMKQTAFVVCSGITIMGHLLSVDDQSHDNLLIHKVLDSGLLTQYGLWMQYSIIKHNVDKKLWSRTSIQKMRRELMFGLVNLVRSNRSIYTQTLFTTQIPVLDLSDGSGVPVLNLDTKEIVTKPLIQILQDRFTDGFQHWSYQCEFIPLFNSMVQFEGTINIVYEMIQTGYMKLMGSFFEYTNEQIKQDEEVLLLHTWCMCFDYAASALNDNRQKETIYKLSALLEWSSFYKYLDQCQSLWNESKKSDIIMEKLAQLKNALDQTHQESDYSAATSTFFQQITPPPSQDPCLEKLINQQKQQETNKFEPPPNYIPRPLPPHTPVSVALEGESSDMIEFASGLAPVTNSEGLDFSDIQSSSISQSSAFTGFNNGFSNSFSSSTSAFPSFNFSEQKENAPFSTFSSSSSSSTAFAFQPPTLPLPSFSSSIPSSSFSSTFASSFNNDQNEQM